MKDHPFVLSVKKKFVPACILLTACACIFLFFLIWQSHNLAFINRAPYNTSDFDTFTTDIFCQEISENTINLHFSIAHPEDFKIYDYPITLGDYQEDSILRKNARVENYLNALHLFSKSELSLEDQITYEVLEDFFTLQLDMAHLTFYEEPLSPSSGVHAQLPLLLEEYVFYDKQDIEDYLQLLSVVDDYFAEIVAFEKQKSAQGLFMPSFACEAVIAQCKDFCAASEDHFLIQTFNQRLENLSFLSQEEREAYCYQNEQLIKNELSAAYQYLADEMAVLSGSHTNEMGLCYFAEGKEYYEYLVYAYTGCSDTIPEILESIYTKRSQDLLFTANLMENDNTLMDRCDAACLKEKSPADTLAELQTDMLSVFPTPPDTSYTIDYIDECLVDYVAPAYYITPPIDDYSNHSIHIRSEIDSTSLEYFTTLAHEGFPGHLYQTLMSYESELAPIRNIVNYSGYTEGWATYVEMLSYQYADIEPAIVSYMQKNQAIILSLYATTDLCIHYDGWTLSDTIDFWNSYGIDDDEAIREIYEYIVGEPGVYLQYYVGYLEFLELKEMAQERYGNQFNELLFHQALLDIGPAPFDIIEKYFDLYYLS